MTRPRFLFGALALVAAAASLPMTALASGGVFTSSQGAMTVTDHKVAISLSATSTSIWDELHYTGAPADFAWVMPVKGQAELAVGGGYVFSMLDEYSPVLASSPYIHCYCNDDECTMPVGIQQKEPHSTPIGSHEEVGPYDVVRVSSSDPQGLSTWFATNGYAVPADVAPMIDAYVAEGYDFFAVRLKSGAAISDMRPIRVTTPGLSPHLPLRLMRAGSGSVAPLTLWIVGSTRWAPKNMPSFAVDASSVVWDWDTQSSNYSELVTTGFAGLPAPGWLIENARAMSGDAFEEIALQTGYYTGSATEAAAAAQADYQALVGAFGSALVTVTRLRADLPHDALTLDLELEAGANDEQPNPVAASTKGMQPECPIKPGTTTTSASTGGGDATTGSTSSGSGGGGGNGADVGGGGCSVSAGGGSVALAPVAALVAALATRRRRARRSTSSVSSSRTPS
ncbi:MAG: DUF2330 domain-containing protein [Polyangiaceae bacterium]